MQFSHTVIIYIRYYRSVGGACNVMTVLPEEGRDLPQPKGCLSYDTKLHPVGML